MKKFLLTLVWVSILSLLFPSCAVNQIKQEEDPVVLTWYIFGVKQPDHDRVLDEVNQELREKLGVELRLEVIPSGEFDDTMRLMTTSREPYDLVFTSNWKNEFDINIARQAFLPLDELYEKYGQAIKSQMPEWLESAGRVDGTLYAIPNQQVAARQAGLIVQKEYADAYGLTEEPMQSLEEIEPFLQWVTENVPDKIPIDVRDNFYQEVEYENFASGMVWVEKDDPYTVYPVTEINAGQLELDRRWYEKGYLRKDIATITDNTEDVMANRYVCTLSAYKPGLGAEWTARQGIEYIAIPVGEPYMKAASGNETMTAISRTSEHSEEAMQLLNLLYEEPELFNKLLFGLEGIHYTKTGDDSIELIEGSGYCYGTEAWKLGNQFLAWRLPGQEEDVWEETTRMNETARVSLLRGFNFDPQPVQKELTRLAAVEREFKKELYRAEDLDAYRESYRQQMEEAGLTRVVKEVQRQLDSWRATKGTP